MKSNNCIFLYRYVLLSFSDAVLMLGYDDALSLGRIWCWQEYPWSQLDASCYRKIGKSRPTTEDTYVDRTSCIISVTVLISLVNYMYHPPTNLREGNVFTGVCHTVQGGVCMPEPMSLLGGMCMPGRPRSFPGGTGHTSGAGGGWRYTMVPGIPNPPRLVLATTTHTVEVVIETALWLLICNSQSQQTASTSPNERNAQHLNDWWVEGEGCHDEDELRVRVTS